MAEAHRIKSEQKALEAACRIAEQIRPNSGARDKERRLPFEEIEWFSQSGLWGITVPKEYGGAGVSTATFTEVVAIVVAIDIGIARAAINETVRFVKTRSRPWIDANVESASQDPLTIYQIGELHYQLHAAEALMARAAAKVDRAAVALDEPTVTAAALAVAEAKIAATDIAILATNKLFELAGTQSTLEKYQLDRHWRNARVHTLHDPVRWKYHAIGNFYLNEIPPPRHAWL
jgi:alkylation response protein AidB-like acyl-CoA dehydrogenase